MTPKAQTIEERQDIAIERLGLALERRRLTKSIRTAEAELFRMKARVAEIEAILGE